MSMRVGVYGGYQLSDTIKLMALLLLIRNNFVNKFQKLTNVIRKVDDL